MPHAAASATTAYASEDEHHVAVVKVRMHVWTNLLRCFALAESSRLRFAIPTLCRQGSAALKAPQAYSPTCLMDVRSWYGPSATALCPIQADDPLGCGRLDWR
jgi:hypothetical protein